MISATMLVTPTITATEASTAASSIIESADATAPASEPPCSAGTLTASNPSSPSPRMSWTGNFSERSFSRTVGAIRSRA